MQWNLNYQPVLPLVNTGDIIYFSGQGAGSQIIKLFTASKWSHLGMVFREGNEIFSLEGDVLINGSGSSLGIGFSGVSMINFVERIEGYKGEIAVRRLINIPKEEKDENQTILKKFSEEVKGRPFQRIDLELVKSVYDGPFGLNKENLSRIFCSELVAAAYQRIGVLPPHPPGLSSNEYTPADFASESLTLLKGKLTEILPIKFKS